MILFSVFLQVYELMRKCWENTPARRITFKSLIDEFTRMLTNSSL